MQILLLATKTASMKSGHLDSRVKISFFSLSLRFAYLLRLASPFMFYPLLCLILSASSTQATERSYEAVKLT